MDKLDLILQKLDTLDEVKEIVIALREQQEVVSAKLDVVTMDVHKLNGEMTSMKEQVAYNAELQTALNNVTTKIAELETDLKLVKKVISA